MLRCFWLQLIDSKSENEKLNNKIDFKFSIIQQKRAFGDFSSSLSFSSQPSLIQDKLSNEKIAIQWTENKRKTTDCTIV